MPIYKTKDPCSDEEAQNEQPQAPGVERAPPPDLDLDLPGPSLTSENTPPANTPTNANTTSETSKPELAMPSRWSSLRRSSLLRPLDEGEATEMKDLIKTTRRSSNDETEYEVFEKEAVGMIENIETLDTPSSDDEAQRKPRPLTLFPTLLFNATNALQDTPTRPSEAHTAPERPETARPVKAAGFDIEELEKLRNFRFPIPPIVPDRRSSAGKFALEQKPFGIKARRYSMPRLIGHLKTNEDETPVLPLRRTNSLPAVHFHVFIFYIKVKEKRKPWTYQPHRPRVWIQDPNKLPEYPELFHKPYSIFWLSPQDERRLINSIKHRYSHWYLVAVIAIIALVVGLGVGFGTRKHHSRNGEMTKVDGKPLAEPNPQPTPTDEFSQYISIPTTTFKTVTTPTMTLSTVTTPIIRGPPPVPGAPAEPTFIPMGVIDWSGPDEDEQGDSRLGDENQPRSTLTLPPRTITL